MSGPEAWARVRRGWTPGPGAILPTEGPAGEGPSWAPRFAQCLRRDTRRDAVISSRWSPGDLLYPAAILVVHLALAGPAVGCTRLGTPHVLALNPRQPDFRRLADLPPDRAVPGGAPVMTHHAERGLASDRPGQSTDANPWERRLAAMGRLPGPHLEDAPSRRDRQGWWGCSRGKSTPRPGLRSQGHGRLLGCKAGCHSLPGNCPMSGRIQP